MKDIVNCYELEVNPHIPQELIAQRNFYKKAFAISILLSTGLIIYQFITYERKKERGQTT